MVSFSVADNRYIGKNPDGSAKTKPVFVDCVAFGRNAEYLTRVAKKGTEIFFEAELDYDMLTYQNGTKVPKLSFVIMSVQAIRGQKDSGQAPTQNSAPAEAKAPAPLTSNKTPDTETYNVELDDEDNIPF
jgi:single-stranded DNA-binding protein